VKNVPARASVLLFGSAIVLVAAFAGCGEDVHSIFEPPPDADVEAGDVPPPPPFAEAGPGDGGGGFDACGTTCSSDLHQVLDCNGGVIETCPPDKGCGGGACILPCDSAQANKSSLGCDYYAVNPDTTYSSGACYAVFVANTWNAAISITADYAGTPLDMAGLARIPSGGGASLTYAPLTGGKLQPGEIAILFLAAFGPPKSFTPACPAGITPGVTNADAALHATGIGHAFHITTTAPVSAYDIFPYGGGVSAITSASLLLPTTAWDTNYIAVDAYAMSTQENADGYPWIQMTAAENDTHVTISPTKAIVGGVGVAASDAGAPHAYTLQKGEVLQITQASYVVSPQHGIAAVPLVAFITGWRALHDLSPGSAFLHAVNDAPMSTTVPMTSIYTCTDEYIQPYTTSAVPGATNISICGHGFVGHFQTMYDPSIYLMMHDALVKPI
jgi:hypothetical protein